MCMIYLIYNNNKVICGDILFIGVVYYLDMVLVIFFENVENCLRLAFRMDFTSGDIAASNGMSGVGIL